MLPVWCDNSPDSLLDMAARLCVLNLPLIRGQLEAAVDNGMHLPSQVGEQILQVSHRFGTELLSHNLKGGAATQLGYR